MSGLICVFPFVCLIGMGVDGAERHVTLQNSEKFIMSNNQKLFMNAPPFCDIDLDL